MQKITPCLWFDWNAAEAVELYQKIFKDNFKQGKTLYYDDNNPHGRPGEILTVDFELFGQSFIALNGGPQFPHTNAVSFMIDCKDQAEIDYYWDSFLKDGGKEQECSWITDKFGLAWQVASHRLFDMYLDPNKKKAQAAMAAMMTMVKIDLAAIEKAFNEA